VIRSFVDLCQKFRSARCHAAQLLDASTHCPVRGNGREEQGQAQAQRSDSRGAEEQEERNALKSRRYYIFKKGGQLETIRTKLAEFGLEVVRLEDIRDDESTPPPSPDGSKRSDHPTSTRSAEKHVDKAPRQKPVFARARSLFGTGDVHESNAMPDGVSCLRDAGPYTSSPYLEGLGNRIVKMDAIGFLMHVVEAHAKKCPESCIRLCNGFKCGESWQFRSFALPATRRFARIGLLYLTKSLHCAKMVPAICALKCCMLL
jgi:hypothetical protein